MKKPTCRNNAERDQIGFVQVPLPMAEVWAEMQTQAEGLIGQAGLEVLRAVLEEEVTRQVDLPIRPGAIAST